VDLSIIIVNYNVKEFLQNLLHSLEKASSNISKEIIVVDNASDDGSVELLKSKFPKIKLIENKTNLGFGKANNQALNIAAGKYLLMINPDTIVGEDTLEKTISFFKSHGEAGLAGCKILNPDGTLQLACRRSFPGPWTSFCKVTRLSSLFPKSKIFARYNLTYLDENQTYEVDAVSGSFMMMTKDAYNKVGGFDEEFFMYGEDLDLCYRIQKAGFQVFYVHDTQIIHYKGESTRRSALDETKVFYDAMHLFVKKHLSGSFLVELILRSAIGFRKLFAFLGKRKLIFFSIFTDFVLFNFCLFLAENIYKGMTGWVGFDPASYYILYTVPAVIHIIVAAFFGVYKKETLSILRNSGAVILSLIIVTSVTFFFKQYAYSRAVVIISYTCLLVVSIFWRALLKLIFRIGVKVEGARNKRTIVVGTDDKAVTIAKKLRVHRTDIHSYIGLLGKSHSEIAKVIEGFEVAGSIENFNKVLRDNKINEVILSSKELSYSEMMYLVSSSQNDNIDFKISGTDLNFLVGKTSVSMLDDIPLVEFNYNISSPLKRFVKQTFDYILGIAVLFSLYPFIYFYSKITSNKSDFGKLVLGIPLILSGKASFVGPKNMDNNDNIFLGKKGLTGLWYIENGDEIELEKLDFYYAKNQNIWLDLEIIGKTLNKILNRNK
jgi:GT2 family glycosyltransferase